MRILKSSVFILFFLFSCSKEDKELSIEKLNSNEIKVVELSKTANFQGDELGIYGLEFSGLNDFTLRNTITRFRDSEGIKEHLSSYALTKEVSDLNMFEKVSFSVINFEKTNDLMEPQFLKSYRANNAEGIEEKVRDISNVIFGNEQTYSLKTNSYLIDENHYIPELISIENVGNFDESIMRYRSKKSNFSMKYNADVNNKNGVALLILWDGTTQDMSMDELGGMNMDYKNKIVVFDPYDSGVLNVPQSAVSQFPENANITLVLMRGNAKIVEKGNKKHYFVTSSEQYEHIVLEN